MTVDGTETLAVVVVSYAPLTWQSVLTSLTCVAVCVAGIWLINRISGSND